MARWYIIIDSDCIRFIISEATTWCVKFEYNLIMVIDHPKLDNCLYQKCYCEENIWQFCNAFSNTSELLPFYPNLFVAFISNNSKQIPLWKQRAGDQNDDGLVVWDYHVICILKLDSQDSIVYDLDTTLSFPSIFREYLKETFKPFCQLKNKYQRFFRVISATNYLNNFASNRDHMRDSDGQWLSPPPSWPLIKVEGIEHNLDEFWSMDDKSTNTVNNYSKIMNIDEFENNFTNK